MTQRIDFAREPLQFAKVFWPDVKFYKHQEEILQSIVDTPETFVVAGNMLGKDYVAGFAALWAFMTHPVARVVTTSVRADHMRVLWGEIGRFIRTCRIKLRVEDGGPLIVNHWDIRKVDWVVDQNTGKCKPILNDISYLRGMVSEKGEGCAGHHAPYTLAIIDEASGVDDVVYTQMGTWAKRLYSFGNPNPVEPIHWFRKNCEAGDLLAE